MAVLALVALQQASGSTMNNVTYLIANPATPNAAARSFRGEFFEVLGPATTTHYSEVFWAPQPVALPADIVARFDGKVIAFTGYEVDIVRTNGEEEIVDCREQCTYFCSLTNALPYLAKLTRMPAFCR